MVTRKNINKMSNKKILAVDDAESYKYFDPVYATDEWMQRAEAEVEQIIQKRIDKARKETAMEIIENLKCPKCGGDGVIVEVSYRWAIDPDGREYEEPYQELCQCSACYATGYKILNNQDVEQLKAKYIKE